MNVCVFSPDRVFRYSLEHVMEPLLPAKRVLWVGLNPSTADEEKLDPTLRRVRDFSLGWGFTAFVMTNLFAFRATNPADMMQSFDPVGPENDDYISIQAERCDLVIACWGSNGFLHDRAAAVEKLLWNRPLECLGLNANRTPRHPLYVPANQPRRVYRP